MTAALSGVSVEELKSVWNYVTDMFQFFETEEIELDEIEDGWFKSICHSASYDQLVNRPFWCWLVLRWLTLYMIRNGYILGKIEPANSNLMQVISMLQAYRWSYYTGYIYDRNNEFVNEDTNVNEWMRYVNKLLPDKDKDFVLEALNDYYCSFHFIWDEVDQEFQYMLCARYILLRKSIKNVLNVDLKELKWLVRGLSYIHNFNNSVNVKICNEVITVCIVVPQYNFSERNVDEVWEDSNLEPSIGILLEIIDRFLYRENC